LPVPFGTYINIASAIQIGMFPALPMERFQQVGNAAGLGARQMLLSTAKRRTALAVADRVAYIELTTHPDFQAKFVREIYLHAG
jgi:uncharacterized 2Fe-2S/4Fe-4S cluster protein (DUF4445 family)